MYKLLSILIISSGLVIGGCSQQGDEADNKQAESSAAATAAAPEANKPSGINAGMGRITDIINAAGYYYIQVDANGKEIWLASNPSDLEIGQEVRWGSFAPMPNFHSKALDKTFDVLFMVSQVVPADQAVAAPNRGTVTELLAGGGYHYLEVDTNGEKKWLAAPMSQVNVGDTVTWGSASPMANFSSSSLGRTFDVVYFVGGVSVIN